MTMLAAKVCGPELRPLQPGTVDRGAAEIAGLEILYELLEQSPHLLCQWRLTTHGET